MLVMTIAKYLYLVFRCRLFDRPGVLSQVQLYGWVHDPVDHVCLFGELVDICLPLDR